MFTIEPINYDSSWLIKSRDVNFLIDPWLIGYQTDGISFFSRQWHVQPCVNAEQLPAIRAIIISHPFTDHMHLETLQSIPGNPEIICQQPVYKQLKNKIANPIILVEDSIEYSGFDICFLSSKKLFNSVHKALYIKTTTGDSGLLYAPHGFIPSELHTKSLKVNTIISTITEYGLFFVPGGKINLGLGNAEFLVRTFEPGKFVNTHDEEKKAEGFVARVAHVKRNKQWRDNLSQKFPALQLPEKSIGKPIFIP